MPKTCRFKIRPEIPAFGHDDGCGDNSGLAASAVTMAKKTELSARVAKASEMLVACSVCPRMCGTARLAGEIGLCRAGKNLKVASWTLHQGEEPPISGTRGSGAIFLSGCSLRCVYCQNYPISQMAAGQEMSVEDLTAIMLKLQASGAHNINFVTPTHYAPQILDAILRARSRGLAIPIVWNTSGYERVETLRLLAGIVDIYLADMRYGDDAAGRKYSKVPDYASINRAAIQEMHRQVGILTLDSHGLAERGLLVRHLVLPGGIAESRTVLEFLAQAISPQTAVSVMGQYFPAHKAMNDPLLRRQITAEEYDNVLAAFEAAGLEHGFCQEL